MSTVSNSVNSVNSFNSYSAVLPPSLMVFFFLTDLEGTIPPFTGKSMWNLRSFLHWVFKGTDPVVAL